MKKKKDKPKETEEIRGEEEKPWLLQDISPEARKIAKESARKQGVKVGKWVNHVILHAKHILESDPDETIDTQKFSEIMEEVPDKSFMRTYFISLSEKIDHLSKKLDKPWWKFWD